MKEGIPYIAMLDHYMSNKDDTPISENVSEYLRANTSHTVSDLIEYLLTHNSASFASDQRNIATLIRRNIELAKQHPSVMYLKVKLLDPEGEYREIPDHARRKERERDSFDDRFNSNSFILNLMEPALPLFEIYNIRCHPFMTLSMIVTGVGTGGAPYKAFDENKVS